MSLDGHGEPTAAGVAEARQRRTGAVPGHQRIAKLTTSAETPVPGSHHRE